MVTLKSACNLGGLVRQRFLLAFMLFMAVINTYTMRQSLNLALVKMCKPITTKSVNDFLAEDVTYDFDWNFNIQGQIKAAFYYGYVLTHIPGGYLSDRFGGKWILCFGLASTSIATLIIPEVSRLGGWVALYILRIATGLAEGVVFPAIGVLLAKWVPLAERTRIGTAVMSGAQLGSVFTFAITGQTLHYWRWDYTFYFYGFLGVVFCIFWVFLCFSVPEDHPYISDRELNYLQQTVAPKKQVKPVPWKSIFSSLPVWGLIVGQVGHDWGLFTMLHELPSYFNDILKFNIKANGWLNALPYLCMWVCSILLSILADALIARNKVSILTIRRGYTLLASAIPAAGMMGLTFPEDRSMQVAIIVVGMAGMGGYYPGMRVNAFDMTKNYAGTVIGLHNGIGSLSGAVSPALRGILTPNNSLDEWRKVYFLSATVLVVTCLFYWVVARGERQIWDYQDDETPPETTKKPKKVKTDKKGDAKAKDDKEKEESQTIPPASKTPTSAAPPTPPERPRPKPW